MDNINLTISVESGDVFINGQFVAQCCFDADAIGSAVAAYISEMEDE